MVALAIADGVEDGVVGAQQQHLVAVVAQGHVALGPRRVRAHVGHGRVAVADLVIGVAAEERAEAGGRARHDHRLFRSQGRPLRKLHHAFPLPLVLLVAYLDRGQVDLGAEIEDFHPLLLRVCAGRVVVDFGDKQCGRCLGSPAAERGDGV
jgi:hypothetical protein